MPIRGGKRTALTLLVNVAERRSYLSSEAFDFFHGYSLVAVDVVEIFVAHWSDDRIGVVF